MPVKEYSPQELHEAQTGSAPPDAAPDDRNALQRGVDSLTEITPEQDAKTPGFLKPLAHFGAGAIQGATSPFVHPLKTIEGAVEGVGKIGSALMGNEEDANDIVGGIKSDPAKFAGNLVGGATDLGLMSEASAPLLAKIPTKAKAGALFETAMGKAQNEPVWMQNSGPELVRARELMERGGGRPTPVNALNRRVGNVNQPPLTYREARDYATNLSRLSSTDAQKLTPVMGRQAGKLSKAFNQDVGDAAARAGAGPEYTQAMRDYRIASQIDSAKDAVKTGLKRAIIPAAIGAGGYQVYRELTK